MKHTKIKFNTPSTIDKVNLYWWNEVRLQTRNILHIRDTMLLIKDSMSITQMEI